MIWYNLDVSLILEVMKNRIEESYPSISDTVEDWLDEFNTFSTYQVLSELIDLWG